MKAKTVIIKYVDEGTSYKTNKEKKTFTLNIGKDANVLTDTLTAKIIETEKERIEIRRLDEEYWKVKIEQKGE